MESSGLFRERFAPMLAAQDWPRLRSQFESETVGTMAQDMTCSLAIGHLAGMRSAFPMLAVLLTVTACGGHLSYVAMGELRPSFDRRTERQCHALSKLIRGRRVLGTFGGRGCLV